MLVKIDLTREIPTQAKGCRCSCHRQFIYHTTEAAKTRPTSESSVTRHSSISNSRKRHGPASSSRFSESSNDVDDEDSIKGFNKTRHLPANCTHSFPNPVLGRSFAQASNRAQDIHSLRKSNEAVSSKDRNKIEVRDPDEEL
ncbi:hypothetical protein IFR05_009679 [Cadophora sp. M221]|nr:hypothetical protein IFR05_009679 [Cadophora sp. M221]